MPDLDMTDRPALIIDLSKRYGGADVRVLGLARGLEGRRPYLVATLAGAPIRQRLQSEGLAVLPLPYGRADPRLFWCLYRIMRRRRYHCVDTHNSQSMFWGLSAAWLAGVPQRIATIHSIYPESEPGRLRGRLYDGLVRLFSRLGVRYIAVSNTIAAHLNGMAIAKEKVRVVYNGLTVEPSPPPAELRRLAGWSPTDYVVCAVGRLAPVKGHRYLLEAVAKARVGVPHLRCLIVGDGSERPALEALSRRLGLADCVYFAGFRPDVEACLADCDLFCLPSLSEGLPFALLEAALLARPLVLSRLPGLEEHFDHGTTARMVPAAEPDALASALRWCVDHPKQSAEMAQQARALVEARFNPAAMIEQTLDLYDGPFAPS